MKICSSCNRQVTNEYVEFRCPEGSEKIVRCAECRKNARPYTCAETSFVGP